MAKKRKPARKVKKPARRETAPKKKRPRKPARSRAPKTKPVRKRKPAPVRKPKRKATPKVKSRRKQVSSKPAKWFADSIKRAKEFGTAVSEATARRKEIAYIADSIRLLRRFFKGYESADGFSLKPGDIQRIPASEIKKIRLKAAQLRREMSSSHVIADPKNEKQMAALYTHTGAKKDKKRKAFVVHVADPDRTVITIEPGEDGRPAQVVEETLLSKRAKVRHQFFYFKDYARRQPRTIDEVLTLLDHMLPDMPDGYYVFVSRDYGNIAAPMPRNLLKREIADMWLAYDKIPGRSDKDNRGLAQSLIGFSYVSKEIDGADEEYNQRLSRARQYQKERERAKHARRMSLHKRMTGK